MGERAVLLEARGLTVRFGGHLAVDAVDLAVRTGSITGLIGPNGAGKTTTFNALCGLQNTAQGTVHLANRDLTPLSPHKRARLGLARTFQRLETFALLSVRENILAGAEFRQRGQRAGVNAAAVTDELIQRLHLGDVADERVDGLPTGRARLVEVGRALANGPRVLLLDEPSSGLNEAETTELGIVLGELAADGLAVLLVEHDMKLVMGSCEEIYVLDFGRIIASGTPAHIQSDDLVRAAYLGADHEADQHSEPTGAVTASARERPADPSAAVATSRRSASTATEAAVPAL
ncbi:MAG: ABC transporter ATP-binding protein, partial [Aquihabitans sp.]